MTSSAAEQLPLFFAPAACSRDIEMGDWVTLFSAVTARLRFTAAGQPAVTNDEHALQASGRLRADVLDCVTALDQLHGMLSGALERQRGLEIEIQTLRSELASLRQGDVGSPTDVPVARRAGL